ncbi:MAG: hypothetical protein J6D11_04630 [Clostridia bacterium]|nr:hypothetical protein [Clostridia bacterium]
MNQLVYLFELDSNQTSNAEIEVGQKALFREIVVNGNQVALTFNQLTDSEAFLKVLENPQQYNYVLELFKVGAIKISLYNKYVSASKYIINAIEQCLDSIKNNQPNNAFLFDALKIKKGDKDMLERARDAIVNNNLLAFDDLIEDKECALSNAKLNNEISQYKLNSELNDLISIKRYISFIINIDIYPKSVIRPNDVGTKSLSKYLLSLFDKYQNDRLGDVSQIHISTHINKYFCDSLILLKNLYEEKFLKKSKKDKNIIKFLKKCFSRGEEKLDPNKRSVWFNLLEEQQINKKTYTMAIIIIDLCYNYAVEDSIVGVSRRFYENDKKQFFIDFEKRLIEYWILRYETKKEKIHFPLWGVAVRFIKSNKFYTSKKHSETFDILYKNNKLKWFVCILMKSIFRLGYALLCMPILAIIVIAMDAFVKDGFNYIFKDKIWWHILLLAIISNVLGEIAVNGLKAKGFLEYIKEFFYLFFDFFYYLYYFFGTIHFVKKICIFFKTLFGRNN